MTKAELIDRIARSRDLPPDTTKKCIAEILDITFDELAAYFKRARITRTQSPRFTFPGFGTFTKKRRSARRGVNPRTLEPIEIEASYTLDFKPGSDLRAAMNPQRGSTAKAGTGRKKTKKKSRRGAKTATGGPREGSRGRRKTTKRGKAKRRLLESRAAGGLRTVDGRTLTPRDEDAELDALIDDECLFEEHGDELPEAPLQRVRARGQSTTRRRTG
jgi:DNA-binding protein HU-beta